MSDGFDIAVECVGCEEWFDENYIGVCGECDEGICPKCAPVHVCAEIGD